MADIYFMNEKTKYMFYLTECDEEQRTDGLGITEDHYTDQSLAFDWFVDVCNKIEWIHGSTDEKLLKAYEKACRIYNDMIGDA